VDRRAHFTALPINFIAGFHEAALTRTEVILIPTQTLKKWGNNDSLGTGMSVHASEAIHSTDR
jgi:hypothetical protein